MNGELEFANNPEPRCEVCFVFDTSGSMTTNNRIGKLNAGLQALFNHLKNDHLANRRVDLAIVTVGGEAKLVQDFVTVANIVEYSPPQFVADGGTPMDQGLNLAIDALKKRTKILKENAMAMFKPMIFVISDGEFHISSQTQTKLLDYEAANGYTMFAIGVGTTACPQSLTSISASGRGYLLDDTNFAELFQFISTSLSRVSNSQPGDKNSLTLPANIKVVQANTVDI